MFEPLLPGYSAGRPLGTVLAPTCDTGLLGAAPWRTCGERVCVAIEISMHGLVLFANTV
jgi:hypothetical protein